jgi:starch synthase
MSLPALRYEPEAYQLSDNRIMGRQSAGEAFLKAIARGSSGQVLSGFGPLASSAKAFSESIFVCSPQTKTDWIFPSRLDKLSQLGGVHFPDPVILDAAKARLRLGPAAYSITGVTHTIASQAVMKFIAEIPTSPLMPWDGLICTSKSVKDAVHKIIEAQEEYLSWRLNVSIKIAYPEFPIIPLGVQAEDFQHPLTVRNQARHSLGIQDDEVVFLFLGRLSFHAKANPFPMYEALEAAAKKTDKRITLIQCGWFANKFIEDAFKSGGQKYAPSVKQLWLDGLIERDRLSAWSSGDIFISLPDNIQETFGLAPLEAMAAGMPVIVSDWDGYRETVPHGIVGFRVPTSAPKAPLGEVYAHQYATGLSDYDNYIGLAAQHVSLDIRALTEAAVSLAESASLRRGLGEAGRRLVSDGIVTLICEGHRILHP